MLSKKSLRKFHTIKIASFFAATSLGLPLVGHATTFSEMSEAQSGIVTGVQSNFGVAWLDYDNDGFQDLITGGTPNILFHNEQNGSFSVMPSVRLSFAVTKPEAIAVGDYNGDGFDDVFMVGVGGLVLLKNNNGDGSFSELLASNSGIDEISGRSAAFGDIDNDGDLDLYITSVWGSCAVIHSLYINNGNAAVAQGETRFTRFASNDQTGCAWQVSLSDYDKDGDLDIFIVNDIFFGAPNIPKTELWHNNLMETGSLSFIPRAQELSMSGITAGMGIASGDFDNNGFMDYYFTDIGAGTLSLNNSQGFSSSYLENSIDGVGGPSDEITLGSSRPAGWGTVAIDADNDGWQDIFRVNQASVPIGMKSVFMKNTQGAGFVLEDESVTGLVADDYASVATADFDNDGDQDLILQGYAGSPGKSTLFRNDTNNANRALKIRLQGALPNHRAIGAKVLMKLNDGSQRYHEIISGSSHGATNAFPFTFGLGSTASPENIHVEWPGGCSTLHTGIDISKALVLKESDCSLSITSMTPSGSVGSIIRIEGANLFSVSQVLFNTLPAQNILVDAAGGFVLAMVPPGASSGRVFLQGLNSEILRSPVYFIVQ